MEPFKALRNSFFIAVSIYLHWAWAGELKVSHTWSGAQRQIIRCTLLDLVDNALFDSRSEFRVIKVLESFLDMLTGFKIVP